ncbi:MAG TPA: RDD family protein [Candidatus Limnocylindria bacterium]|nr:RDD family protein [Candidatus Limnocylindria bacterium]
MDPRPAPLWRLAAAAVADALLGIVAWSLAAMWLIVAILALRARPLDLLDALVLILAVLVLGVALHVIYHTVLVGGCGQTLGKMLLGVAVVRRDGAPAGYGRALLRCVGGALCLLTLGLGRLFVLFTRDRRALSDFVAGTRPITTPHPGPLP